MLDGFTPTPERAAIISRLEEAEAALAEAARLLAADPVGAGRSRRVADLSQHAAAQKSLVAQDWRLADAEPGGRAA